MRIRPLLAASRASNAGVPAPTLSPFSRLLAPLRPALAGLLSLSPLGLCADSVVVFNEVMYHPSTTETQSEWVELHNQMAVDVDLSGWSITGGIEFVFAEGTVIPGGGYRVVAISPVALEGATGLTNVLGPFTGRLSNAGETLRLLNRNRRLMDTVSYGVDGDWSVAPDGSGVSLAKRHPDTASEQAANWMASAFRGGTPGARNFSDVPFTVTSNTPLPIEGSWVYQAVDVDPDAAWKERGFADTVWTSGRGLFRDGTISPPAGDAVTVPTVFSTGLSDDGTRLAAGSPDPHYWLTESAASTPPPPAIRALVIHNHPAWLANDTTSSWIGPVNPGTTDVAAGSYHYRTHFSLEGFDAASASLKLRVGVDNGLADVLLNGVSKGITYEGFSTMSREYSLASGFVARTNTLDFLTSNYDTAANPAGFRTRLSATARRSYLIQTPLPSGHVAYLFRSAFTIAGSPRQSSLRLSTVVADGAVFYLNGAEVLRVNLPPGPIHIATPALTNVVTSTLEGPFVLSTDSLVEGTNVLAVELHRGPGPDTTVLFGAALSASTTNVLTPPPVPLAFNEIGSATTTGFWIECINHGATVLDLEGYVLSHAGETINHDYVLPPTTLDPGELLVLNQIALGFGTSAGDHLFLLTPARDRVLDAVVVAEASRGRHPDGKGRWTFTSTPTSGSSNQFQLHDEIVINELMYHAPDLPTETWLELFNRSDHAIDLTGWRLSGDLDFAFPAGTTLPTQGYLVVARDVAAVQAKAPDAVVLGPFAGNLPRSGGHVRLMDAAGNLADEVAYADTKPWPGAADGGGSSLELRDPESDNSRPEAWAPSLESPRAQWADYSYRGIARNQSGPTLWKEFVLGLLDAGECLLDDLSVVEDPSSTAVSLLQNGDFESGLTAWRALGDHNRSRVEVDPDHPANHVLHLVATGPTDHLHNHLETTLASGREVTDGVEYQIAFRAKWLTGNHRLNTRLYFNRVAQTTALNRPLAHGTPGSANSTRLSNLGPTFAEFDHSPVVPPPNESVTVTVRAGDAQGVSAAVLRWSVDGGGWNSTPMTAVGAADAFGYARYEAVLPGWTAGTLIQMYVQATDSLGAVAVYPAGGTASRALFRVDPGGARMHPLHRFRLLMTAADAAFLHAPTNVMSMDLLGATLVYNEREVFYDVGIHLQGSERGRDDSSRVGFTVRLNADHLFRGVQDSITIDRSGGYSGRGGRHDEILLWQAVNHAGGLLGLDCDLVQVFAPRSQEDSTGLLRMSAFDGDYFDHQFDEGGDGNLYTLELIYYPTTTVNGNPEALKLPQPDDVINIDIQDLGPVPENYRWLFLQENHADQDDYTQVVALSRAFSLSGVALETQINALVDTDQFLRTLAFKAFTGDVDTYTEGYTHNWKFYFRPGDGQALGLLWDMDFAFVRATDAPFPGSASPNTYRLVTLPNNRRRYSNHLLDLLTRSVNAAQLQPWANHYAGLLGEDWSGVVSYLQQRADYIRSRLPLTTAFAITSNGGADFATTNDHVTLTGTAPMTVKDLEVNGVARRATWTSQTAWTLTVPLPDRINLLTVQGLDNDGRPLTAAADSITVTNLGTPAPRAVVINEWMADNAGPGGFHDPAQNGFPDWFELYNPNMTPVNLAGYYLTDELTEPAKWQIPPNTVISGSGFLLVWADRRTDLNGTSPSGDLHANFQLSNAGEALALFAPDGALEHAVSFGPQSENVSLGLFPDGDTNQFHLMTQWTPRQPNRVEPVPAPTIGEVTLASDGTFSFSMKGLLHRLYRVDAADNLAFPVWTPLMTNRVDLEAFVVSDQARGLQQRYYRVVLIP